MVGDLLESRSLAAIVREHFKDQVLELAREVFTTGLLPVCVIVSLYQKTVVVLILLRLLEWEDALSDNEKDDAGGKDVNLHAVICFLLLNFRCHVRLGSLVRFQAMDFSECSETKICDLKV